MNKEAVLDVIGHVAARVAYKRSKEPVLEPILAELRIIIYFVDEQKEFDYNKIREFINTRRPVKMSGYYGKIDSALLFLKQELHNANLKYERENSPLKNIKRSNL